jgi:hypothetical protein
MLWTALALGAALLVPLVTRGSYRRLLEQPWRWGSFLVAGLAIQLALDVFPFRHGQWHDLGYGLLVMSYVLLLGFIGRNTLMRGMAVVFIGVALNLLAILVNQGMPVKVPPDWRGTNRVTTSVKHHPRDGSDHLIVITDIIVLRSPFNTVLSFGDLIIAVGLCDVTYHASRRRRRRGTPVSRSTGTRQGERTLTLDVRDDTSPRPHWGDVEAQAESLHRLQNDATVDDARERLNDDDVVHVVRA